jgi:hypothetical protein
VKWAFLQEMKHERGIVFKKKGSIICKATKFLCILDAILKKRPNMKRTIILITTVLTAILFTNKTFAQEDLVRVFRWFIPEDQQYVTVAEGEYQDGQLLNWGWTDKTLIFWAYRSPGPGRVAVNGWQNPVSRAHISVCDDEFSDDQMLKNGYTQKHLQFYALTRRGPNTVCVYRWLLPKRHSWITIPDDVDTDPYIKKGYRHKTYQYYGVYRSVDAPIYDQL